MAREKEEAGHRTHAIMKEESSKDKSSETTTTVSVLR